MLPLVAESDCALAGPEAAPHLVVVGLVAESAGALAEPAGTGTTAQLSEEARLASSLLEDPCCMVADSLSLASQARVAEEVDLPPQQ